MKNSTYAYIFIVVIVILFAIIGFLAQNESNRFDEGYIQACKDFHSGKLKADLIENEDGTKEWKIMKDLSNEK